MTGRFMSAAAAATYAWVDVARRLAERKPALAAKARAVADAARTFYEALADEVDEVPEQLDRAA